MVSFFNMSWGKDHKPKREWGGTADKPPKGEVPPKVGVWVPNKTECPTEFWRG